MATSWLQDLFSGALWERWSPTVPSIELPSWTVPVAPVTESQLTVPGEWTPEVVSGIASYQGASIQSAEAYGGGSTIVSGGDSKLWMYLALGLGATVLFVGTLGGKR